MKRCRKKYGRLGAIIAEGEDEGKFLSLILALAYRRTKVTVLGEKKDLIGQVVEVRADSISKVKMDHTGVFVSQDLKHLGGLKRMKNLKKYYYLEL